MNRLQFVARLGIVGGLWTLLNVYVGAHLLGPAPLAGLPRLLAWGAVVIVAWLPLVALATARRETDGSHHRGSLIRLLDWAAYTMMGLSSLLIVAFFVTDLLRLPASARVVLVVVSGAALLTLVGIVLARRPRVVRVTVPISPATSPDFGFSSSAICTSDPRSGAGSWTQLSTGQTRYGRISLR